MKIKIISFPSLPPSMLKLYKKNEIINTKKKKNFNQNNSKKIIKKN